MIVFRLSRRAVVVFTVTQVAPDCRPVGAFRMRGRAGVNRLRFSGRIANRLLPPGTYRLRPRIPGAGRMPSVVVVILPRGADLSQARRLRSRDACAAQRAAAAELFGTEFGFEAGGGSLAGASPSGGSEASGAASVGSVGLGDSGSAAGSDDLSAGGGVGAVLPRIGRALGVTSPAEITETFDSPWFLAALVLAILLLGLAAAPQGVVPHSRAAALVAYRRLELAVAGALALLAITVTYLIAVT